MFSCLLLVGSVCLKVPRFFWLFGSVHFLAGAANGSPCELALSHLGWRVVGRGSGGRVGDGVGEGWMGEGVG